MKTLIILLTALAALGSLSIDTQGKEYTVKNIGKGGLKSACGRGGGSFTDGENSYSCTYGNGNIRECSKRDGHCITVTPGKLEPTPSDGLGAFGTFQTMGMAQFD